MVALDGIRWHGDLVSKGTAQANKEAIHELTDEKKFINRVRELKAATSDSDAVLFWDTFIETWKNPKRDPFRD